MDQQFSKLKGSSNWNIWKFQIKIMAEAKSLQDVVFGGKPKPLESKDLEEWIKKDCKAKELLVSRMEDQPMVHILTCESSFEMWSKLLSIYEQKSETSIHLLHERFFNYRYENKGIATHISSIMDIASKLKQLGENISEKQIMTKVLMSLPSEMKYFVSSWESVDPSRQSFNELTSRLIIEEGRVNLTDTDSDNKALVSKTNMWCSICSKNNHTTDKCFKNKDVKPKVICHFCSKSGHIKKNCRLFKNKNTESKWKNAFVSTAFTSNSDNCNKFYLDSGATEHMCPWKEYFGKLQPCKKYVKIGDGSLLEATGIGNINVTAIVGDKKIPSILKNVLFVPSLKLNLFSLTQAMSKGYSVICKGEKCQFVRNGQIFAEAILKDKMFELNFEIDYEQAAVSMSKKELLFNWHRKLAHQNIRHVKDNLSKFNIKYSDDIISKCDSYVKGKQCVTFSVSETKSPELQEEEVQLQGEDANLPLEDFYKFTHSPTQYEDKVEDYMRSREQQHRQKRHLRDRNKLKLPEKFKDFKVSKLAKGDVSKPSIDNNKNSNHKVIDFSLNELLTGSGGEETLQHKDLRRMQDSALSSGKSEPLENTKWTVSLGKSKSFKNTNSNDSFHFFNLTSKDRKEQYVLAIDNGKLKEIKGNISATDHSLKTKKRRNYSTKAALKNENGPLSHDLENSSVKSAKDPSRDAEMLEDIQEVSQVNTRKGYFELNNILNEYSTSQEMEKPITDTGQSPKVPGNDKEGDCEKSRSMKTTKVLYL